LSAPGYNGRVAYQINSSVHTESYSREPPRSHQSSLRRRLGTGARAVERRIRMVAGHDSACHSATPVGSDRWRRASFASAGNKIRRRGAFGSVCRGESVVSFVPSAEGGNPIATCGWKFICSNVPLATSPAFHMVEHRERILLVDDESADRLFMTTALESKGYSVIAAGDAQQALREFRQPEDIEMLVSDVALPGMNGCDLAKRILAEKPNIRVLFVSGHVGAEVCKVYGFPVSDIHFLRKPFSAEELNRRVRELLNRPAPFPVEFEAA
jgi:CheY-like chemotaxis protein